ncbi:MAG: MOSC domain-containing protein [Chloroflexi bacterium]|nr:MOSC domain-containing protein [Chloroflexota bacterium]
MKSTIISLQICTGHRAPMQMKSAARAIENRGLEGDRHARANGSRQVLLMDEETLKKFQLAPGVVKENVTTRGLNLYALAKGTRLKMGDALFEITKACEPCERMDEIRAGLRAELVGQRGMLVRVLKGGAVRVGDAIEIVK